MIVLIFSETMIDFADQNNECKIIKSDDALKWLAFVRDEKSLIRQEE